MPNRCFHAATGVSDFVASSLLLAYSNNMPNTLIEEPQTVCEAEPTSSGALEVRHYPNLVRCVRMKFFQDSDNGEWGLTHDDTQSGDECFNAFWSATGIFHDVFEHAHEHSKYFRGEAALNVGGEMAAMGAMYYFIHRLGLRE